MEVAPQCTQSYIRDSTYIYLSLKSCPLNTNTIVQDCSQGEEPDYGLPPLSSNTKTKKTEEKDKFLKWGNSHTHEKSRINDKQTGKVWKNQAESAGRLKQLYNCNIHSCSSFQLQVQFCGHFNHWSTGGKNSFVIWTWEFTFSSFLFPSLS